MRYALFCCIFGLLVHSGSRWYHLLFFALLGDVWGFRKTGPSVGHKGRHPLSFVLGGLGCYVIIEDGIWDYLMTLKNFPQSIGDHEWGVVLLWLLLQVCTKRSDCFALNWSSSKIRVVVYIMTTNRKHNTRRTHAIETQHTTTLSTIRIIMSFETLVLSRIMCNRGVPWLIQKPTQSAHKYL